MNELQWHNHFPEGQLLATTYNGTMSISHTVVPIKSDSDAILCLQLLSTQKHVHFI